MGKIADWFKRNSAGIDKAKEWANGSNPAQPLSWAWFKGLWNDYTGNTQIDKQLAAQKEENQFNRDYNKELAVWQNEQNLAQWSRENAYNSPSAQKQRLEAAGLNPDLMYGGSGVMNTAASSPAMTSGAPSSPMDWSSLANKKTLGDSIYGALNNELLRAQIDKVKAETKETLANAGLAETNLAYADVEKKLGLKLSEQAWEKAKQDYDLGAQAIERNMSELEGLSLDNAYKAIRNAFESEVMQKQINILSEELNIKKAEAQHALEYYAARNLGLQADNAWKDASWIVQQKQGTATLIKYGAQCLETLVDGISSFIPKSVKKNTVVTHTRK